MTHAERIVKLEKGLALSQKANAELLDAFNTSQKANAELEGRVKFIENDLTDPVEAVEEKA